MTGAAHFGGFLESGVWERIPSWRSGFSRVNLVVLGVSSLCVYIIGPTCTNSENGSLCETEWLISLLFL